MLWSGSAVIVFSSFERRLIGWYLTRGDISNVCCHGDHIYMVANDGEDVYKLKIQSLRETLLSLASMDLNIQVVKVRLPWIWFHSVREICVYIVM